MGIAEPTRTLVARAREGKLRPEECANPTLTLSSRGVYPVDRFRAIINPPLAITLAAGLIRADAVVEGERGLTLTLSWGRWVVDGVAAACFTRVLRGHLEVVV